MSLIKDEIGNYSTARAAFWLDNVWTIVMVTLKTAGVIKLEAGDYGIMSTMFLVTGGWAAGPRIMQHLGPQISSTVKNIVDRVKGLDNRYKDDERE
jgi:hypothetical protein